MLSDILGIRRNDRFHRLGIPIAFLCIASTAQANAGIPTVSVGWPFMLANLIFVVGIESLIVRKLRPELTFAPILQHVGIANLITTVIGYPLIAGLEALTPLIGINLGWMFPFPDLAQKHLYLGTSMLITLVPCYFLSVWVEGRWLRSRLSSELSWKDIYVIHLASYLFLTVQVYTQLPIHLFTYGEYTFTPIYKLLMTVMDVFKGK